MKTVKKIFCIFIVISIVGMLAGCMEKKDGYSEYVPGDHFVTNTKEDTGMNGLVKVSVVLVLNKTDMEEEMKDMEARVRDTIVAILRSYTMAEYKDPDTEDILRENVVVSLNERLGIDYITDVLFTDFVVQ